MKQVFEHYLVEILRENIVLFLKCFPELLHKGAPYGIWGRGAACEKTPQRPAAPLSGRHCPAQPGRWEPEATYPSAGGAPPGSSYAPAPRLSCSSCFPGKAHTLCLRPPWRSFFLVLEKNAGGDWASTLASLQKKPQSVLRGPLGAAPGEAGRSHPRRSSSCFSSGRGVKTGLFLSFFKIYYFF